MDTRFHPAQAALADGDVEAVAALLADDPDLAKAKSQRSHPTLLQCVVLTIPPVPTVESLIDLLARYGAELTDPLIAASGVENLRAVVRLLDLGADIEGNGRWSPLEEALYWGNEATVSLLLERGAAVDNLRTASSLGDLDRVALCFDESGEPNALAGEVAWPFMNMQIPEAVRRDPKQIVGNALVYAAAWGRSETVTYLLGLGAPVNLIPAGFDFAGTALHYAALRGRKSMVDQLLGMGADPALPDAKIGKLPEDWAAHDGHTELAEHLRQVRLSQE
jgi:uncharacterized protein